ncbi:hypothetical protein Ndes2437B_g00396 [Nannochloris sp. 'desiccata']
MEQDCGNSGLHLAPPPDHIHDGANADLIFQDQEEFEALGKITHAFREYRTDAEWEIKRWEYNYSRLSPAHQHLLPHIPTKIATARQCIYQNHLFLKSMLDSPAPEPLCYAATAADAWAAQHGPRVNPADADKVRYVLKNMMRDWSTEGEGERKESYGATVDEVKRLLLSVEVPPRVRTTELGAKSATESSVENNGNLDIPRKKVLVPGCGLGRLCAELASLGFETIGNEHSYYMLIASAFVLNDISRAEQWTIAPWVHSNNNHLTDADQLRPVFIPDVVPSELIERTAPGLLGMAAGEFTDVFNHVDYKDYFDAVATCFFIDTSHNIIQYLETVWHCLKPGGYWVNLGPLQWHWADAHTYLPESDQLSIEISLVEVQRVAQKIGFVMLKSETGKRCRYMCDDKSMLHQTYECAMWTAQKPAINSS